MPLFCQNMPFRGVRIVCANAGGHVIIFLSQKNHARVTLLRLSRIYSKSMEEANETKHF